MSSAIPAAGSLSVTTRFIASGSGNLLSAFEVERRPRKAGIVIIAVMPRAIRLKKANLSRRITKPPRSSQFTMCQQMKISSTKMQVNRPM